MKTGQITLSGIRYRLDVHEGMATFVELDRMTCTRITVQKHEPHGLLYVQATSHHGFVPYCHIENAVAASESFLGPNHYPTLAAMHAHESRIAASHVWRKPMFKISQRLFWAHDVKFRFASIWRALKHSYRSVIPECSPRIEWAK